MAEVSTDLACVSTIALYYTVYDRGLYRPGLCKKGFHPTSGLGTSIEDIAEVSKNQRCLGTSCFIYGRGLYRPVLCKKEFFTIPQVQVYTVNRSRHKVNMTHNVIKLPQVENNKSHLKHILLYMCQICLSIFLTHGVPNTGTSQVKQTEYNCEAYFTQHVSNVTLWRCQIYSVDDTADVAPDLYCVGKSFSLYLRSK
jgi:hypothetical protein